MPNGIVSTGLLELLCTPCNGLLIADNGRVGRFDRITAVNVNTAVCFRNSRLFITQALLLANKYLHLSFRLNPYCCKFLQIHCLLLD